MRFTVYRPNEALRRFANPTTWGESVLQKRNPTLTGKNNQKPPLLSVNLMHGKNAPFLKTMTVFRQKSEVSLEG
jgi:hypothetical protein